MRGDEGREIAGFRIESEIGRGGMGVVYLAHQTYPERRVALKVLSPDLASDPAFRERFVHESNAAASTEHPNIVPGLRGRGGRRSALPRDALHRGNRPRVAPVARRRACRPSGPPGSAPRSPTRSRPRTNVD